jgi:signal peptidase I
VWQKGLFRWFFAILIAAIAGIVTGHTVIASVSGSVCVVDGASMLPTFSPGTRVYAGPISTPLERGDIILVDDGNKEYALKRIIGLPGEKLQFWRGYVFINRKMLREPYLAKHTYTCPDGATEISNYKLGDGEYFVWRRQPRTDQKPRSIVRQLDAGLFQRLYTSGSGNAHY